jgi:hypothetical protein
VIEEFIYSQVHLRVPGAHTRDTSRHTCFTSNKPGYFFEQCTTMTVMVTVTVTATVTERVTQRLTLNDWRNSFVVTSVEQHWRVQRCLFVAAFRVQDAVLRLVYFFFLRSWLLRWKAVKDLRQATAMAMAMATATLQLRAESVEIRLGRQNFVIYNHVIWDSSMILYRLRIFFWCLLWLYTCIQNIHISKKHAYMDCTACWNTRVRHIHALIYVYIFIYIYIYIHT